MMMEDEEQQRMLAEEKHKIANMPFTTRSGKERLRSWPLLNGGTASPDPDLPSPGRKTFGIKTEEESEGESADAVCEPDPSNTVPEGGIYHIWEYPEELDQDVDYDYEADAQENMDDDDDDDDYSVKTPVEIVVQGVKKPIVMPGQKTKKSTSYVWNYFYPNPDDNCQAVCSICKAMVSRGRNSNHLGTSSLLRHLQRIHHKFLSKQTLPENVHFDVRGMKKPIVMPGQKTKKSTSYVWNYFYPNPDNNCQAVCSICKVIVSRGRDSNHLGTSSLLRHLQRIHHMFLSKETLPKDVTAFPASSSSSLPKTGLGSGSASNFLSRTDSPVRDSSDASISVTPVASASKGTKNATCDVTKKAVFVKGTKYSSSHPFAQRITDAITTMLVLDVRPVSAISSVGFTQLLDVMCPRYQIPSRLHFTRKAIPSLYTEIKKSVLSVLKNAALQTVHLTTDMWTSGTEQTKYYRTVTAHWLDIVPSPAATAVEASHIIIQKQATLCITTFNNRHTAEKLLHKLRVVIAKWLTPLGLSSGFMISDDATNIVRALHLGKFQHVRCFAHTLNLVVQNFLKNDRGVQEMLSVVRKICGHFRHSASACRRLRQLQAVLNLPCHQLKQEVVTRWNSTLYMLQRMEEQQKAIHSYTSTCDIGRGTGMHLSEEQWRIISVLCKILKPFEVATREVSSDTASLSQVIPLIGLLQKQLEKLKEELRQSDSATYAGLVDQALNSLSEDPRVLDVLKSDHYILATILDPRFKSYVVSLLPTGTNLQRCKEILIQKLSAEAESGRNASPSVSSAGDAKEKQNFPKRPTADQTGNRFDIWSGLKELPTNKDMSAATAYQAITIERMVDDYFGDGVQIGMSDSPFTYWQEKNAMWRPLHKLALFYLSCPPSSVHCERVFRAAGNVSYFDKKMMFIKMNYTFYQKNLLHQQSHPNNTQAPVDSSEDELIVCEEEDGGEETDAEDDLFNM